MSGMNAYSLACGYVQRNETPALRVDLWREHGVYHVRSHHQDRGRLAWETFRTLKPARKEFSRQWKEGKKAEQ